MGLGPAHSIKFCSTNGANTNGDRRPLCIEHRNGVLHFTFGLALHAICFHTLTLIYVIPRTQFYRRDRKASSKIEKCFIAPFGASAWALTYFINISPGGVSSNVPPRP